MRFTNKILAMAFLCGGFASTSAMAADAMSKAQVQEIVHEFLMDNPEVIFESIENYRTKQEADKQAQAAKNIEKYKDYLTSKDSPSAGNPNGDVTIVEFFDYNCGYCKKALSDVAATISDDDNVRFIFKEMPILSASSRDMARWALAANKQGKYFEYHVELMKMRGSKDTASFRKLGSDLGMDADQLEKDANSEAVKADIEKSVSVARELGVNGTPAFIINGEMYPGYLGPEGMKKAIKQARAAK